MTETRCTCLIPWLDGVWSHAPYCRLVSPADDQPPHVDGQDELFPDPRTTTEVPF